MASLLHDRAGAEDVTALAFERAYRRRASYRPSRGTAEAWLFGIARNAALDELRRRGRRATLEADPEDLVPAAEERLELTLRRATVRSALDGLGARERELLALKFAGGLSNAEIAGALGLSESIPDSGGSAPSIAPRESRRRVERSASLTLAAPDERLDAVADG